MSRNWWKAAKGLCHIYLVLSDASALIKYNRSLNADHHGDPCSSQYIIIA